MSDAPNIVITPTLDHRFLRQASMLQSPLSIQATHNGVAVNATIAWTMTDDYRQRVLFESATLGTITATADDAFEALSLIREQAEPLGWRIGVLGSQIDVWPSGMARDQGSGLVAYRFSGENTQDLVEVFHPIDPSTACSFEEQAERFAQILGNSLPRPLYPNSEVTWIDQPTPN